MSHRHQQDRLRKLRSAGSTASSKQTEPTGLNPVPPMPQTLKPDTDNSAQQAPWTAADVKRELGIDPNDPNVEVRIMPMSMGGGLFETIFGSRPGRPVTGAVTSIEEADRLDALDDILEMVEDEVHRAVSLHGPMQSPHEGYAVIKEELDELWDLVKTNNAKGVAAQKEAVQIAAMGIRYLLDVVGL